MSPSLVSISVIFWVVGFLFKVLLYEVSGDIYGFRLIGKLIEYFWREELCFLKCF